MTVRLEELLAAATPGPWIAKTDGMFPVVTKNESYATVMEFSVYGRDGQPEAEANAQLVALAPDAVRLLIDMGEQWRRLIELYDGEGWETVHALLARLDRLGT